MIEYTYDDILANKDGVAERECTFIIADVAKTQIAMLKENISLLLNAIPEGWEVPLLYSNIVGQVEEELKKIEEESQH